jgi:hypothetical protein
MAKETLVVADQYRTNDLSVIPGGKTVKVIYTNGALSRSYTNIKNVASYCNSLMKDKTIAKILVDDVEYWVRK